jgi:hypothetical protein
MHSTDDLIQLALKEDIGPGDITTDNLVEPETCGKGTIVAKQELVVAGLRVAEKVFITLDPTIDFESPFTDGDRIPVGSTVVRLAGSLSALLKGERTALNFLQRLSGIATQARDYAGEVAGTSVKLVDTRKTTPGWRVLEKYAVRVGGAYNHRMGLYDGVLIKDNHIAVSGGIANAVIKARQAISHLVKSRSRDLHDRRSKRSAGRRCGYHHARQHGSGSDQPGRPVDRQTCAGGSVRRGHPSTAQGPGPNRRRSHLHRRPDPFGSGRGLEHEHNGELRNSGI